MALLPSSSVPQFCLLLTIDFIEKEGCTLSIITSIAVAACLSVSLQNGGRGTGAGALAISSREREWSTLTGCI